MFFRFKYTFKIWSTLQVHIKYKAHLLFMKLYSNSKNMFFIWSFYFFPFKKKTAGFVFVLEMIDHRPYWSGACPMKPV